MKRDENGARSFDELLEEMSEEVFGEKPGDDSPPKLEDTMEKALFGDG